MVFNYELDETAIHEKSVVACSSGENSKLELDLSNSNDATDLHSAEQRQLLRRTNSPPGEYKRMHRVVFTGGPCAGKTTGINKIKSFFENIGWKVLVVPETAYTVLSSGIYFHELNEQSQLKFQENLLKTLLQIEDTVNETAKYYTNERDQNCLVIYDRGAMDPVSYLTREQWEILKQRNPAWNEIDLRDNRYDQVVHLVTAALGAEQFYTLANNCTRTETIELARELDERCSKAWLGHPCMDVVDNQYQSFERKISKALQVVCERVGLNMKGFGSGNRKRKFLVRLPLPSDDRFPDFKEVNVVHNYLVSSSPSSMQVRLRKSGQGGNWSYSYATRTCGVGGETETVDTRTQIDFREYALLEKTIDRSHSTVYVKRRCFIWRHGYYRLDIYEEPCEPNCRGLVLLVTRSSATDDDLLLPDFIQVEREVTNDPAYSMFNLSKKAKLDDEIL